MKRAGEVMVGVAVFWLLTKFFGEDFGLPTVFIAGWATLTVCQASDEFVDASAARPRKRPRKYPVYYR